MSTPQPPDCWLILAARHDGTSARWVLPSPPTQKTAEWMCSAMNNDQTYSPWKYTPVRMVPAEVVE